MKHSDQRLIVVLFWILMCLYPAAILAADGDNKSELIQMLSLGGYFSSGKYGLDSDTDITFVPLSYELAKFPWRLSLSAPYLDIEGQNGIVPQTGNVRPVRGRITRPLPSMNMRESGLCDISLKAAYQPQAMFLDLAYMEFAVLVKLPTADAEKGLGTGETDFSAQWDLFQTVDANTWFATLGYIARGKTGLYDLQNSAYLSLGAIHQFSATSSLGISFDYSQAASNSVKDIQEVMPLCRGRSVSDWI